MNASRASHQAAASLAWLRARNAGVATFVLLGGIASYTWFMIRANDGDFPPVMFFLYAVLSMSPILVGAFGLVAAVIGRRSMIVEYIAGLVFCLVASALPMHDRGGFVLASALECFVVLVAIASSFQQYVMVRKLTDDPR